MVLGNVAYPAPLWKDLEWAVRLALEVRRRVKEQQKHIGAAEFHNTHFSCTMGDEGAEKLHGATISNSRAKRYLADLQDMKVWVADGQLHVRRTFASREGCDYAAAFADAVNHRLAALVEAA